MIDQELIEKKIDLMESKLNYLKDVKGTNVDEFLDSFERVQATKHTLQEAMEACLDVANHIIAAKGLERPDTYSGMFKMLVEEGILERQLGDKLGDMAKFRNLLVHQYTEVDDRKVFGVLSDNLEDIEEFIKEIEELFGERGI